MKDNKVRIGFVGVGGMGQCAHLKNYLTWPGECEVMAIAEIRPELGKAVARRYGVGKVYADHRQLLDNEELDGIVASQPFTRHGVLLEELAQAGKPIFTEKPLAGSVETAKRILAAEKQYGAPHMVGYHKRSDPAAIRARQEIQRLQETGELGAMRYVRLLMPAGDWIAEGFSDLIATDENLPENTEFDPPAADMDPETTEKYIAFVNYYIHQINLLRYLLGEPYRVTYAEPSGVLLAAESESGIACTIEMSPYTTRIDWQEHALVCFEKGWIRIDLPAPLANNRPGRVTVYREPDQEEPQTVIPSLPWIHAMRQQALNFIAFCRGECDAPCTAEEALDDLVVARDYIRLRYGS